MPPLDPKEEAVVAAYIKNGGNQTAAWKSCHPESRAKAETIHQKASRFFAQGKVRARILELHLEVVSRSTTATALTVEEHMEKLRELRDLARERGQLSAAIRAEIKRGEVRRFYVKQVESGEAGEFDRMTDDELRAFIAGQDKIFGLAKALNRDDRTRRLALYARHHSYSPRGEARWVRERSFSWQPLVSMSRPAGESACRRP